MKHLKLTTAAYNYILKSYGEWLQTMSYAKGTIKTFPVHVKEYLHYLEGVNVRALKHIKRHHGKEYVSYLKTRQNKTRGGGLMQSTINKQVVAPIRIPAYCMAHLRVVSYGASTHKPQILSASPSFHCLPCSP
jgi:integrase/recombinase XerD